ncbi:MAG: vitamin K epoxide reductase family protein, partial [Planctomycetota bacterium]
MASADLPRHPSWTHVTDGDAAALPAATRFNGGTASRIIWAFMLLCSLVAVGVSVYLAWASLTSSKVAGCGGGSVFDCSHVLHSRWSTVLGMPVSIPAILTHLSVIAMLLWSPSHQRGQSIRWSMLTALALAAGGAALWFIGLQVFWLQHLCPYCLVAHTGGLVLMGLALWARPANMVSMPWVGSAAGICVAGLIVTQFANPEPQTYEVIAIPETAQEDIAESDEFESFTAPAITPDSGDIDSSGDDDVFLFAPPSSSASNAATPLADSLAMLQREMMGGLCMITHPSIALIADVGSDAGAAAESSAKAATPSGKKVRILNRIELNSTDWPLVGDPNATYVFVEMFDYTCPHCQQTHQTMTRLKKAMGGDLAVMTLPVPLNSRCNSAVKTNHSSHAEACELARLSI